MISSVWIFRSRLDGQRGFSLVEMLMVMAIFSVVMMAVVSLFIPVVRSTSVQTELSDVQANMRLAMNRMTQDLLTAGFLVSPEFDAGGTQSAGQVFWEAGDNEEPDYLILRTRAVGDAFARVVASVISGGDLWVGLSDADMALSFPPGSSVRLFDPMMAREVLTATSYDETVASEYDDYVYTIVSNDQTMAIDGTTYPVLQIDGPATVVNTETVVLRVRDASQPPMQTIRYQVADGALHRIVNGATQVLARNIDTVQFAYETSPRDAIKRVDVTLTRQTEARGNDALASAKERMLRTSVTLRNVY